MNEFTTALPEQVSEKARRSLGWAKRGLDITLAGIGLLLSAPLWGLIAIVVKCYDGGSVFFYDHRMGRGGASSVCRSSAL